MKKVNVVIVLVTLFALFYNLSPFIGVPDQYIIAMFLISPFLIIFMVYVILKYGIPSGKTFDQQFYDDLEK